MTPETLKEIEDDYARWCNDPSSHDRDVEIPARVMDYLPDLIVCVKERDTLFRQRDELIDQRDAAVKERDALRAECDRTRRELVSHREKAHENYWAWQGDGEDHLESLVCPVLIHAEALRTIIAERDAANVKCAEMRQLLVESPKPWRATHGAAQQDREWFKRRDHALSTDCGKGYHHERDCEPLREALARIESKCNEPPDPDKVADIWEIAKQALAHWEKVRNP